jgi:hypothetical protein
VGEPGQTVNLVLLAEWVRIQQPPPYNRVDNRLLYKTDTEARRYFPDCGCSSVGRASAFQAEGRGFESRRPLKIKAMAEAFLRQCSSGVEHFHGKEGVRGSIPLIGSRFSGCFLIINFISKILY